MLDRAEPPAFGHPGPTVGPESVSLVCQVSPEAARARTLVAVRTYPPTTRPRTRDAAG
ncbi:hypothetical protein GCM10010508_49860 [Streptomyces naganishii JCM 4654]|uniref:Uncharacterized protein n=1 Tax=Streptomyces naganishii JCM 4654 TaxID=1306179 RepID=A0A918Y8A1_9ACTN|nr:hypothetical protein GCM10010508_49860 [Streptomyces naganishii JCM 4654]